MTSGLKIWLWIVLVLNALSGFTAIMAAILVPFMWVVVLAEVLVIAGAVLLLFPRKKLGFYLICGGSVVGLITNVYVGTNIAYSVFSAIIMPLIIWLLIKNTWYEFQ